MAQRYHYLITINYPGGSDQMKLKLRPGSTSEDIALTIRSRFNIPDSTKLVLEDDEGCVVVIDQTLETGDYTLRVIGQTNEVKAHAHAPMSQVSLQHTPGRRYCVFVDKSRFSRAAFKVAISRKKLEDSLTIAHCFEMIPNKTDDPHFAKVNELRAQQGQELLEEYMNEVKDVPNIFLKCVGDVGHCPRETAVTFVNDNKFDMVFVGTRGLSPEAAHEVGSFSYYLVQHAHSTVMVIKNHQHAGRKMVVFVDQNAHCVAAFQAALGRKKPEDKLIIAHCVELPNNEGKSLGHAILNKYLERAQKQGHKHVSTRLLTAHDHSVADIASGFANTGGIDLVFVGTRGLDESLLMTSFSHHLVENVACDVMVIRDPEMTMSSLYGSKS